MRQTDGDVGSRTRCDDLELIPSRDEVNGSSSPATRWVAWGHIMGSQWYGSLVLRQGERGEGGRNKNGHDEIRRNKAERPQA